MYYNPASPAFSGKIASALREYHADFKIIVRQRMLNEDCL